MNAKYTLVVVAMQPLFTTHAPTISNVAREVKLARKRRNPIIFLHVPYHSPTQRAPHDGTYPEILKEVEGYSAKNWLEVEKLFEDGSGLVLHACDRMDFPRDRFRVCGVNTDLSVLQTVKGLLRARAHGPAVEAVEVVKDACRTHNSRTSNVKVWKRFPVKDPRLTLIG